jgi:uncharacterized membrane protein
LGKLDKTLSVALALVFIGVVGAVGYMIAAGPEGERFTEFYLLGSGGNATSYPSELIVGQQAAVTVGIVNHEGQQTSYTMKVTVGDQEAEGLDSIVLADEERTVQQVRFVPLRAGGNQSVEFLLFKEDDTAPYGTLRLFVDVIEPT